MPDELLLHICDQMDTKELYYLTRKSSRVYQVCTEVLQRRKKQLLQELLDGLIGTWRLVVVDSTGYRYNVTVTIKHEKDEILVKYPFYSFDKIFPLVAKYLGTSIIPEDDVVQLRNLQRGLINSGFTLIKPSDIIYGTYFNNKFFIVIQGQDSYYSYCKVYDRYRLARFLYILGVEAPDIPVQYNRISILNDIEDESFLEHPEYLSDDELIYIAKWIQSGKTRKEYCKTLENTLKYRNKIVKEILVDKV